MAARHQARPSRQGRQDQQHRTDLPPQFAHQGIPDRRFLPSKAQGRGHEGTDIPSFLFSFLEIAYGKHSEENE